MKCAIADTQHTKLITHLLLATVVQSYFGNVKDFSITLVPFSNGRRKSASGATLLVSRIAASMQ